MKKIVFASIMAIFILTSGSLYAQETSKYEVVKIKVSMTCDHCKQTIEKNIAFEKGVKDLDVNLETKMITITYNKEKTSPEQLEVAIQKLDFKTEIIEVSCTGHNGTTDHKCNKSKADCKQSKKSCCESKKEEPK